MTIPDDAYQVRRLQPHDAPGVCSLVERVYGTTYPHTELYHPNELLQLNEVGRLVSVVVVDATGQVVGHYALERPDLGAVAETGEGMILPEHRSHHLFPRLRALLEEEARRLGLVGLCGRPLTSHVRSQKVYQEFQCHPTGVELARYGFTANDLSPEPAQPLSVLMYFKYLRPQSPTVYHLPEHHRALVEQMVERLGRAVSFETAVPPARHGTVQSDYHAEVRAAYIHVRSIGPASAVQIAQELAHLQVRGAQAVYLRLPLGQPGTDELCSTAERRGFFFSGLDPRGPDEGDVLQLQWVSAAIDLATLHVDEPFAREVLAYVAAERQRTAP